MAGKRWEYSFRAGDSFKERQRAHQTPHAAFHAAVATAKPLPPPGPSAALRKPDPAIYRKALTLSGTAPGETVFVDDLKANVDSAARLGMIAIRFVNAPSLRASFDALGLG